MKLAALVAALLLPATVAGKSPWLRLRSAHFELYTDAGEKGGRDALVRLERIRRVFTASAG